MTRIRPKLALAILLTGVLAGVVLLPRSSAPGGAPKAQPAGSWSAFDVEGLLSVLKVLGVVVAAAGTIYGATHELYTEDSQRNRHPTPALRYSIIFVIGGLLISLNTTVLEDLSKRQAKHEGQVADSIRESRQSRREQAIAMEVMLASQPLNTLDVVWTFRGVPAELCHRITRLDIDNENDESQQRHSKIVGDFQPDGLAILREKAHDRRQKLVVPWLNYLAGGEWSEKPVVLLLPLDGSGATVIPIGLMPKNIEATEAKDVAGAVDLRDEGIERSRSALFESRLTAKEGEVALKWSFDLGQLANSVDRFTNEHRPLMAFPNDITLTVLHSIERLPVKATNVTHRLADFGEARRYAGLTRAYLRRSVLELRPNGIPDFCVRYEVECWADSGASGQRFVNMEGEYTTVLDHYCDLMLWRGKRVRP